MNEALYLLSVASVAVAGFLVALPLGFLVIGVAGLYVWRRRGRS